MTLFGVKFTKLIVMSLLNDADFGSLLSFLFKKLIFKKLN